MATRLTVRVLYFAAVRDRLGTEREEVSLDSGATARTLVETLEKKHPGLKPLVAHLRVAVNQEFVALEHLLSPGDEVALIPPVAGGSAPFWISREPFRLQDVVSVVSTAGKGGIVTFSGIVRDSTRGREVVRLEYEAYVPMAEKKLTEIGRRAETGWPGSSLAIAHRIGVLKPGDLAVAIAAAAPHRQEAFQACQFCIDRLKEEAPIWKKEIYVDGQAWVGLGP